MTNDHHPGYDGHVAALAAHDVDAVVATYAPDAVKIGPEGSGRGHDYLRQVFAAAPDDVLDQLQPEVDITTEGDVVLVQWRSHPDAPTPAAGADTFVFSDGLIVAHTEVRTA